MAIFDLPDQATVQALQVGQGVYGDLVFGEWTDYAVLEVDNLLAYESRLADSPLPMRDGDLVNGRWAAGRTVVLPFVVMGNGSHATARATWLQAFDTTHPTREEWVAFRDHGGIYLARARVVRRRIDQNPAGARSLSASAVVELKLADPRIYNGEEWVQTAFVPFGADVGGGFNWPVVNWPINMTAATGGAALVINTGNAVAYPLIRIDNPTGAGSSVTSLTLTNETTGDIFDIDTTITEGQILNIDMDALVRGAAGPHVYIDTSSRYGDWNHPRTLFGLAPGNNVIQAEATGGAPVARLDWLNPTL